eukprot:2755005-Prorocentrum_lima.AAC.1
MSTVLMTHAVGLSAQAMPQQVRQLLQSWNPRESSVSTKVMESQSGHVDIHSIQQRPDARSGA